MVFLGMYLKIKLHYVRFKNTARLKSALISRDNEYFIHKFVFPWNVPDSSMVQIEVMPKS